MPIISVTDPQDERLQDYFHLTDVALRSRDEPGKGLYMAESSKVIERAIRAGHRPRSFLMTERWLGDLADVLAVVAERDGDVPVYIGAPGVVEAITGFNLHRGALAAMHRPPPVALEDLLAGARRIAVLEDIGVVKVGVLLVTGHRREGCQRRHEGATTDARGFHGGRGRAR